MSSDEIIGHLEELFEMDPGTLDQSTELKDIPRWDSLAFVGLIALVDEEYGTTLPPSSVNECTTVADLVSAISNAVSDNVRRAA